MRFLSVFLLFGLSSGVCNGQAAEKSQREVQPIYLQFDKADFKKRIVYLQLVNGSKWPIRIIAELPKQFAAECGKIPSAEPRYYLEEYDPTPQMQLTYKDGRKSPPDEPAHPPAPKMRRGDVGFGCEIRANSLLTFALSIWQEM